MANKKTVERKLAELIAKKDAIKTKSAMRRIQRAAKAEKPIPKLTRRQKQLFAEYQAQRKYKAEKSKPVQQPPKEIIPERRRRVDFEFQGKQLMKLFGNVEMGSTGSKDIRDRWIKHYVTADEADRVLNAETIEQAIFAFENIVGYLAKVHRPEHFEFLGEYYGVEFFDE